MSIEKRSVAGMQHYDYLFSCLLRGHQNMLEAIAGDETQGFSWEGVIVGEEGKSGAGGLTLSLESTRC